jgi:uncharacterized protein
MQLENTFTVPTGIDEAWAAFNDPTRVAPCFPGATLDSYEDDSFTGTVKVKLGPISLTYKGKGTFVERDEAAHRVVIDAIGRDSRGNGTASAKVVGTLVADGDTQTTVTMITNMTITGRPAQFGRGMMAEVSDKLVDQFSSCLAKTLGPVEESEGTANASLSAELAGAAGSTSVLSVRAAGPAVGEPALWSSNGAVPTLVSSPEPVRGDVEAIDLLGSAGVPVLKRLIPVVFVALLVLFVVLRRIKHRND